MEWITTKQKESTDGKHESIYCELRLNFPSSQWNKKENTPVICLQFHDCKVEDGWWMDNEKTKWYVYPPHKSCEIYIHYFQRHPAIKLYSSSKDNGVDYNNFTIDYCKTEAVKIFTERLNDVLTQIKK